MLIRYDDPIDPEAFLTVIADTFTEMQLMGIEQLAKVSISFEPLKGGKSVAFRMQTGEFVEGICATPGKTPVATKICWQVLPKKAC